MGTYGGRSLSSGSFEVRIFSLAFACNGRSKRRFSPIPARSSLASWVIECNAHLHVLWQGKEKGARVSTDSTWL
jgi:hypothetical protein